MSTLPDFEAWAIFARVVEAGSFSRAAAELELSKATVSKALTRLEARLGTPLLHRSSRRLSLTPSGGAALERATRLLAEGDALEDAVRDRTSEPRGLVRLTAPLSFGIRTLGPLLPDFLGRHPGVSIDLQLTDRRSDLVADGIDVALRIGVLADSALRARRLYGIARLLVASPGYLAREGAPAHPRELARHAAILFTHIPAPALWRFRHKREGTCEVRVDGRLRLDNADVGFAALIAGVGLGEMPEFMVWDALRDGTLVKLLPEWRTAPAALHIVTPPGPVRPARVEALIAFLAKNLTRAPWAEPVE